MAEKKGEMSREEQIGFHKGALATLAKEREEFLKTLSIVEQLMQMHLKSLKDLGVELGQKQSEQKKEEKKKPIDEVLQ
ncbi:MAG: hypothetical protein QXW00_03765 [Candidatus Woesearchaeota archaeon]